MICARTIKVTGRIKNSLNSYLNEQADVNKAISKLERFIKLNNVVVFRDFDEYSFGTSNTFRYLVVIFTRVLLILHSIRGNLII